ncbi:MAG: PadR family transcriptional regulator [Aggregatilineales bacterium]
MTMMTDAELTILSLLAETPRFGYEIQRLVDERDLRDWLPIGFSSIYYILNKLERQKMLASEMRPDSHGAVRKRYHITDAGQGMVQTALTNLLRQPRSPGTGFELALVNLDALHPATVYRMLIHHRDDLKAQIKHQESARARYLEKTPEPPAHVLALYSHSITMTLAELNWLSSFLEEWEEAHRDAIHNVTAKTAADSDIHDAPTALRRDPDSIHALQKMKRIKDTNPDDPAE